MDLKDRFTKGSIAGFIVEGATTVMGYLFSLVNFGTLRYADLRQS